MEVTSSSGDFITNLLNVARDSVSETIFYRHPVETMLFSGIKLSKYVPIFSRVSNYQHTKFHVNRFTGLCEVVSGKINKLNILFVLVFITYL